MESKEMLLKLRHDFYTNEKVDYDSISYFTRIEKDLDRLEQIDKAKPSETMEFVKMLLNASNSDKHFLNLSSISIQVGLIKIENALKQAQEQEQVINECIKLLSVDGANTKAKVKELLEGLINNVYKN